MTNSTQRTRLPIENTSGLVALEYKVLILPDSMEEVTSGGIIKPQKTAPSVSAINTVASRCGAATAPATLAIATASTAVALESGPATAKGNELPIPTATATIPALIIAASIPVEMSPARPPEKIRAA